jgi:hypothetical protein
MSPWDQNTVTREQAIEKIKQLAKDQGYTGGFSVKYDGEDIEDPADLPEAVDMTKIKVTSKLNNA